jgi:AraC-like DNA-binding protein
MRLLWYVRDGVAFGSWDRGLSQNEMRTHLEPAYDRFTMTPLGNGPVRAKVRYARYGPVVISDITHLADARVDTATTRTGYHLILPLNGRVLTDYRDRETVVGQGTGLLYQAWGDISTRLRAGTRLVSARFDLAYVHRTLETQLGERLTGQIGFGSAIDQASPRTRSWLRMLLALTGELGADDVLMDPLVALPYAESLVQGLLLTADHPYRPLLDAQARQRGPSRRAPVQSAIELMEAEPGRPLTNAVLAAAACVSVRTLHEGFRRQLGTSPMAYLQAIRLRRAHQDLRAADPAATTVAAIARHWGFTHMGRFAAAYHAAYGEPPSAALRAAG